MLEWLCRSMLMNNVEFRKNVIVSLVILLTVSVDGLHQNSYNSSFILPNDYNRYCRINNVTEKCRFLFYKFLTNLTPKLHYLEFEAVILKCFKLLFNLKFNIRIHINSLWKVKWHDLLLVVICWAPVWNHKFALQSIKLFTHFF